MLVIPLRHLSSVPHHFLCGQSAVFREGYNDTMDVRCPLVQVYPELHDIVKSELFPYELCVLKCPFYQLVGRFCDALHIVMASAEDDVQMRNSVFSDGCLSFVTVLYPCVYPFLQGLRFPLHGGVYPAFVKIRPDIEVFFRKFRVSVGDVLCPLDVVSKSAGFSGCAFLYVEYCKSHFFSLLF